MPSKVLEQVFHDQLVSYLLKFNLMSDRQSGFHPQHSTQDVLVYVTDCWCKAIDESKFTAAAFLVGLHQLCRNNFEHNRLAKASSIMPA